VREAARYTALPRRTPAPTLRRRCKCRCGNPLAVGGVVGRHDTRAQVPFIVVADINGRLPTLHLLDLPVVAVVDEGGGLTVYRHYLEPVLSIPGVAVGDAVLAVRVSMLPLAS